MTILGLGAGAFALVAALMAVCGAAIGRLLWLLDGSPPLDRPSWWPAPPTATAAVPAAAPRAAHHRAGIVACVLCCGGPLLVLGGAVSLGLSVVTVAGGLVAGATVLGAAVLGAWLQGRRRAALRTPHGHDAGREGR